jgi:DNA-binding NarL/FixJ family response regulator
MHYNSLQPESNQSVAIKVALVDDHILLREGLAGVINSFTKYKVMVKARNGSELIEQLKPENLPDIILLDLNMPVMNGYEAAHWLKMNYPEVRVVILSMFDSELMLIRLLRLGIKAFVKKDVHPDELECALDRVMKEEYYYSESISGKEESLSSTQQLKQGTKPLSLSENEITFIKWSTTDLTYKEIAREMHVSEYTIYNYWESLKEKLSVKSRIGLAMYAVKNGIAHI